MTLFALGLNHQTAPLAIRERVAIATEALGHAVGELTRARPVKEAAIISTCNRTEIYVSAEQPTFAADWLAEYHQLSHAELGRYLYTLPHEQAVRHAFRVASGLDSMVLGEPQILGQMKQAVRAAESAGTLGTMLHKLFQKSFAVAKEVRTTTQLPLLEASPAKGDVKITSSWVTKSATRKRSAACRAPPSPVADPAHRRAIVQRAARVAKWQTQRI